MCHRHQTPLLPCCGLHRPKPHTTFLTSTTIPAGTGRASVSGKFFASTANGPLATTAIWTLRDRGLTSDAVETIRGAFGADLAPLSNRSDCGRIATWTPSRAAPTQLGDEAGECRAALEHRLPRTWTMRH